MTLFILDKCTLALTNLIFFELLMNHLCDIFHYFLQEPEITLPESEPRERGKRKKASPASLLLYQRVKSNLKKVQQILGTAVCNFLHNLPLLPWGFSWTEKRLLRDSGIQEEKKTTWRGVTSCRKKPQGVSVVDGADMVGDGRSAVLWIFPSEHYTSAFPLLTDACLTSHDYFIGLSGWVINDCYGLDTFCGFTNKSLLYASKLCASHFQQLSAPSPRCLKKVPRGEGERAAAELHSWEKWRERACRGHGERKIPSFRGSKPWDCRPNLYPL